MKKLMFFIALTASVWSSFTYSESLRGYISKIGRIGSTADRCNDFPGMCNKYYYVARNPSVSNDHQLTAQILELYPLSYLGSPCAFTSSSQFSCGGNAFYFIWYNVQDNHPNDPQTTCNSIEGAFIDGFHNSLDDFCAIVGTTGGDASQPLLCTATNISEIPAGSGNFQHTVTAQSCSAESGPTAPDGQGPDPEPCTENCEPTDPPPTGGNDGSDIPSTGGGSNTSTTTVTGTSTDSQGNVTNIEMTFEQDLTPVTERLNEANQRLKVENQNSSTIIDKLNELITGNTNIGQKLDGIKDAINGLDGGTDMSGVEDGIEGLREDLSGNGSFAEGEALAGEVSLPSETDLLGQFQAIQDAINSPENQAHFDALQNAAGNGLTVFESIPQLFQLSSESCTPLPFYKYNLDICGYTSTIRTVLNFVFIVILIIFLVRSLNEDMKKIRMIS